MHKWHKGFTWKTSSMWGGKKPRAWTNRSSLWATLVQSLSRTSRDYNTLLLIAHQRQQQQQQQPQEVSYNKVEISQFLSSSTIRNCSYTADANNTKLGRQVDTCVPSILTKNQLNRTPFAYPNCLSPKTALCWKCSSPNWQNCSQIWTSTNPNPKLCDRIEVLKVRNKITKFGANPSMSEPPITSLKTDRSDLRNLDIFTPTFSFPLLTWLWCSSVFSHPLTTATTFLACFLLSHTPSHQRVARVFFLYLLKEAPQPLDANLDQRFLHIGLPGLKLGCQHTSMWRDMTQQLHGLKPYEATP
jgi:hypothetical protein